MKVPRDAVVFARKLHDPNTLICKRVVALEGDCLRYELRVPKSGQSGWQVGVGADGQLDRAALLKLDPSLYNETVANITIPRGAVWLEGDNQDYSRDSRQYGPVPLGLINSRVRFILYPFNRMGFVR